MSWTGVNSTTVILIIECMSVVGGCGSVSGERDEEKREEKKKRKEGERKKVKEQERG